jgi:hypothetical protein
LWRRGQEKKVWVYRVIAENTTDVFINNIAFDKQVAHDTFTGDAALRKS